MQTDIEGGCLCGAVRYRLKERPTDSGSCHCRTCRKASSAPELPFAQFPSSAFTLIKGYPATFRSSPHVIRTFCRHCGSPLTYRQDAKPDLLDVMTCSLDDPDAIPPAYHVWISHKPRWATVDDTLPAHDTTRPEAKSGAMRSQ